MIPTRYLLPATIAATVHLALLTAFPPLRPPFAGAAPAKPPPTPVKDFSVDLGPPPPAEEPDPAQVAPQPGGREPAPSIPDLIPLHDPSAFTVTVAVADSAPIRPLSEIPTGPVGPGNGPGVSPGHLPVIDAVNLDRMPRAKAQPAPLYPPALRQTGTQGMAMIHFVVDASGRVIAATVESASHREFGEAAARAVLHWLFEPGRRLGRAVPFQMSVPVQFSLDGI